MTTARVSQGGKQVVGEVVPEAESSQAGMQVVGEVVPAISASQAGVQVVGSVQPVNLLPQAGLIVVATATPCSTRRAQFWEIQRTDGVTLRFTSHDQTLTWGGETWETCGSLSESASEQSSDQGAVGNIELTGVLDSDHISEEDLYAGRYNDAFVQVWRASWDDDTDHIQRIAAGWIGRVNQGETGFTAEVLGPGARLLQKPLLQTVSPGCRWVFGDSDTCGVDAEALAIVGSITSAPGRSYMYADIIDPGGSAQWDRGKLRFTYGANTGLECEVREVHFDTGLIILWAMPWFVPELGDTFELVPGCDLAFDGGCAAYSNRDRFGGYPDVPGQDFVSQVPRAKA